MVGVTKYVSAEVARWLAEIGCKLLAESKPQSLWEKASALSDLKVDWHLIGHLQRNKAKRTLPLISTMHSLDSDRVLEQIKNDAAERTSPLKILLEVNISGDPEKTGLLVPEALSILLSWKDSAEQFRTVSIVGLMGMSSLDGGADRARRDFASLRELRDRWETETKILLPELSMGMSDDFEQAVEEGATLVRIGSILFN